MLNKTCYFYWDKEPMSWLQLLGVYSFHKYNPDWKIVVYKTKQDPGEFKKNTYTRLYTGMDYFFLLTESWIEFREADMEAWGLKRDAALVLGTDVFRTNILYENGGVYSDHDVLWLKPMSEFKNVDHLGDINDFQAMTCYFNFTSGHNNLSVMIAEKGSGYIKAIIDQQRVINAPYTDQIYSAELLNRMFPSWESIKFKRMLGVKYETFYPYSTFDLSPLFLKTDLKPLESKNVMAVHWFAGNELSNDYMNKEDFDRECSMSLILKSEGWI